MSEPPTFQPRELQAQDINKGYLDLLSQLTVVGTVTNETFKERFLELQQDPNSHIIVIEDTTKQRIIASGTLLIERKFARSCGKVGHIEDVVVDSTYRGLHLGQKIILTLKEIAEGIGCYKVILDCNEGNVHFYEKCGFKKKEVQMACYFE